MQKHIQDLAREVELMALSNGFTSIEPSPHLIRVNANQPNVSMIDFILRKGNLLAGKVSVVVTNQERITQTVVQRSDFLLSTKKWGIRGEAYVK